jgi:hypothetical protein
MIHLAPAFASVRKLAVRVSWEWEWGSEGHDEPENLGPNFLVGEAGEFGRLDRILSGNDCPLPNIRDVEFEVKLRAERDVDNPDGRVMWWFLEHTEKHMLAILEATRAKHNCSFIVSQEPI